mmetsp:Transcript_23441/g.55317  ORF Transcript_23441/g.55317 Transcript_23441/m.55317 type:complete len:363 (+) Transcript_23441:603-1691(+)
MLEGRDRHAVEQRSQRGREQHPRVASVVVVVLITAVEDSGDASGTVLLVDLEGVAEEVVEGDDGSQDLLAQHVEHVAGAEVAHIEGLDDGGVLLAILGLEDEGAIEVAHDRLLDVCLDPSVAASRVLVAHLLCKLGSRLQAGSHGEAAPEEILGLDLLPEIATTLLPIGHQPLQVILDGTAVLLFAARPQILLHEVCFAGLEQGQAVLRQGLGPEARSVGLRPAPSSLEGLAVGDGVLGFRADVDAVGIRLVLHLQNPLDVVLQVLVHVGQLVRGGKQSMHGEGPISFPVVIVVPARSGVVIRRGHDSSGALDVDVRQEIAADLGLLLVAEGLSLGLVGELALRTGRGRRGGTTLGVEAPGY